MKYDFWGYVLRIFWISLIFVEIALFSFLILLGFFLSFPWLVWLFVDLVYLFKEWTFYIIEPLLFIAVVTTSSQTIIISFQLWIWNLGCSFLSKDLMCIIKLFTWNLSDLTNTMLNLSEAITWITTPLDHEIHQMSLHERNIVTNESPAQRRRQYRWRSL